MPELPEVETVRRGLAPVLEGSQIMQLQQRRPDLRFPLPENFSARLVGRRVTTLARRAKYLLAYLDDDCVLVCHLGMSGSFRIETAEGTALPGEFAFPRDENQTHDHVILSVRTSENQAARIVYNDPRRFGFMLLIPAADLDAHRMFANLGVEPTGNSLDEAMIATLFRDKNTPLKSALLDQRLIAGLGNIYVCEALWRACLDPRRLAGSIAGPRKSQAVKRNELAHAIRDVIAEAIAAGGSSLRDYVHTDGSLGYFQHQFRVYDREGEPCQRSQCDKTIRRIVQSGRSTFYCPACQR